MLKRFQEAHRETFTDGYMQYGKKVTERSSTKKRIGESFQLQGSLAFRVLSSREGDYRLIDAMNSSLDLKIKTMKPRDFNPKRKASGLLVRIDEDEYDVVHVDSDDQHLYLYFYLQRVGGRNE